MSVQEIFGDFGDEWLIDLIISCLLINGSIVKSQKARTDYFD